MKIQRKKKVILGSHLWAIPAMLASSVACSQPPAAEVRGAAGDPGETRMAQDPGEGQSVDGLPFSQSRSFSSLDSYLAFLKERGAHDVPWYREVRPGIYELVSRRRPGTKPQTFTREELARKFGFTE